MASDGPAYKMAVYKTRRKGTKLRWRWAVWYQHWHKDGTHAVRFMGTTDFLRGDEYEILRKGQEE